MLKPFFKTKKCSTVLLSILHIYLFIIPSIGAASPSSQEDFKESAQRVRTLEGVEEKGAKRLKVIPLSILRDPSKKNAVGKKVRFAPMPKKPLPKEMKKLCGKIVSGLRDADWKRIKYAFDKFQSIEYHSDEWEEWAKENKVSNWQGQTTSKEAVGAHIFFPKDIFFWETIPFEAYRLERLDYIWALAYSAFFGNPVASYFVADILGSIRKASTDDAYPFFENTRALAVERMEGQQDHSDTCYTLGKHYVKQNPPDTQRALSVYAKGGDLKNRYAALLIRGDLSEQIYEGENDTVLGLARAGFLPAYLELYSEKPEVDEAIYLEASDTFPQIRMPLASLYRFLGKGAEANEQYHNAMEEGVAEASLQLAFAVLGDLREGKVTNLRLIDMEIISQAEKQLMKAGKLGNPEGWYLCAILHRKLYQIGLEKLSDYRSNMQSTLGFAAKMGYQPSYICAQKVLKPQAYQRFVQLHGLPPYGGIEYEIQKLWESREAKSPVVGDVDRLIGDS